jgi:hypothetical protein
MAESSNRSPRSVFLAVFPLFFVCVSPAQQTNRTSGLISAPDYDLVTTTTESPAQPSAEPWLLAGMSGLRVTFSPAIDDSISVPDDWSDDPAQQNSNPPRKPQTKRILGVIPNFRSVSTDEILPPQTPKEKFLTTTQDSFDYSAAVVPILLAGYSLAIDSTPEFGHGWDAYGQYLWRAALDQTTENYLVEFVVPVLTHQDSRYYTLGRGGFFKRTGYALSRVWSPDLTPARANSTCQRSWEQAGRPGCRVSTTLPASAASQIPPASGDSTSG